MKYYPLVILFGLLLFSGGTLAIEKTDPKIVEEVRMRTQQVVPFALDQVKQTFIKTVHGGMQHVIAKSEGNEKQIKLIREHLAKIAEEFRKGDFSMTERMHGPNMPGLKQLKKAEPGDIRFEFEALPNGGQIHYSSEWPRYVRALHEWFDAQLGEHGGDELPEHSQHHSTDSD